MEQRKNAIMNKSTAWGLLAAVALLPLAIREGDPLIVGLAALIPFFAYPGKEFGE
jgi:hypothetical protein